MDTLMDTNEDSGLLQLLQPLSEAEPCGPAMRHDAVFTEIRLAREEDDPSLPMGQWERPLKKADWQLIDRLCQETLSTRTKDLQLAAWLTEAWTRLGGFGGLAVHAGGQRADALGAGQPGLCQGAAFGCISILAGHFPF
jgi:type VI secretion system protein ImpA